MATTEAGPSPDPRPRLRARRATPSLPPTTRRVPRATTTTSDGSTSTADTTGPGETEGEDTTTGDPIEVHWGALVLGTLFTDDLGMAEATHDAVAMGGQRVAMAAGDFGHDALLGTTLLGTTENQFLGTDQWDNLDGALAVYGDPEFQAAFAMLVRGRLADPDLEVMQAMHDAIAMGGEADAAALGDVAHVVWVGSPEDPQEFFAVDVWTDDTAIEAFYGDPMFQKAFGALFEAPPTVGIYASTDWHQW